MRSVFALLSTVALLPSAVSGQGCAPAPRMDAAVVLRRITETIAPVGDRRVLNVAGYQSATQDFQSDRWYPPFFSAMGEVDIHYDFATGVSLLGQRIGFPGNLPARMSYQLSSARAVFFLRDTVQIPIAQFFKGSQQARELNPIAVVRDWNSSNARVVGRCPYRDYQRLVLERTANFGTERLFVDEKSLTPVKLDREEPHYLWGQVHVEVVWSNWNTNDGMQFPGSVFRLVDGNIDISQTNARVRVIAADSAPRLTIRDTAVTMTLDDPTFLQPLPVDTVRVSPTTVLLRNTGYTQAIVFANDTVWVLDATQGEARAKQDLAWIDRLYPKRKGVALVVTDLAHPHIGGLRFWVSRGATVISHESSRPFLEKVVARRWTRTPDALERARRPMRFVAVRDSLRVGGGALALYPIDGIGSEGAIIAWSPRDRFLWASDYIQNLREASQYATEVWRAVTRVGISPDRVAAQHIPLVQWDRVVQLQQRVKAAS